MPQPYPPVKALIAGVPLQEITPVWQKEATPIGLIEILVNSVRANDKNAPISRNYRAGETPDAVITFSIPPQAPVGIIPQIAMLSATSDTDDVKRAFDYQDVSFSEHIGGTLQWADGVKVYQYQDARLTSASIFEYRKNTDGKRILQEAPIGLTPTATERIAKLNSWAAEIDGLTAFISYKEFTEAPFDDFVSNFNVVTHFDKVAGLNFDGLKYLVILGYPKVDHEAVMTHARTQYAADSEPLPKGSYDELTETDTFTNDGLTITERRYKDPRLEKIRSQLASEKLQQAIGRGRHAVWTDTQSIIFTTAPTAQITERAELFSNAAFKNATAPSDLPDAMQRIQNAIDTGNVQAVMETTGVSKRTAERQTKDQRKQAKAERDAQIIALHEQGKKQREIETEMKASGYKVSNGTIRNVLQARKKRQDQLDILIDVDANCAPTENERVTQIARDNYNTNCPVQKPRSSDPVCSESVPHEVETSVDLPKYASYINGIDPRDVAIIEAGFDPIKFHDIRRRFASYSIIAFCLSDHKIHTASEIAERTLMPESFIEDVLQDWYEKIMVSRGVGKSYWMNSTDIEKCRAYLKKERIECIAREAPL